MISATKLAPLSLFDGVAPQVVSALAARGREVSFSPDAVIFEAGHFPIGWYIILVGSVRVVRNESGRRHVIHTETIGGSLGEVPLFDGGGNPATAISVEHTTCALFTRADVEAAMRECTGVGMLLLRRLATRVRLLVNRLDQRSTRTVTARLAEYLLQRPLLRVNQLSLGLTQVALAEELGTVREVVARELRVLTKRNVIRVLGGGRYAVLDRNELVRLAQ